MEYKYYLTTLQQQKEKIETLVALHSHRTSSLLPQALEQEFWQQNTERARINISQSFAAGVWAYLLFTALVLPGDYWLSSQRFFSADFLLCIVAMFNGAVSLLTLYGFARSKLLQPYFYQAALGLMLWTIISSCLLSMSFATPALKYQSAIVLCFIYMLGFMISGVRPLHMLLVGTLAAVISIYLLFVFHISFEVIILSRVLLGSCLFGFTLSTMLIKRERILFLNTKLAQLNEKIQYIHASELLHLSQHDELTQISNRRNFDETLDSFYRQSRKEGTPLSLLFIDVDFFKNYNDFYGHQMGDKVIYSIARAIKNSIRHRDFVARYGGEEFVVLLPETEAHGAYAVASNIYREIERLAIPHERSCIASYITVSLGITIYRGEVAVTQEALLESADQALYRAKQLGRNQIFYQSVGSTKVA